MFKYFRYFQVYTIIVEREGSFQFNFIYQIKSNERKDDMKIIKQIQVSANTFQKWVKASIPALEDGHWEMFVSHPVTPSEKDNVWTIAFNSAMQSTNVEVRNITGNGDIIGCRKDNEQFHCFFFGGAERVNSLEE